VAAASFKRASGVDIQSLDYGAVLVTSTAEYFATNQVGARIWELLAEPCRAEDITASLLIRFEIDATACRVEVDGFLSELQERRLVEAIDAG
jgi:hypothetical protein